jgi:Uma2 family endonuclease
MAEPAFRNMTLEEFLRWDDGTDTRYELMDGFPVAMAPPAEAHRILALRLGSRIDLALAGRRPCNAQIEPGVVRPDRADSYYVPDIAVTCEPNEPGRQAMVDPILIVEILSPSTEPTDRRLNFPSIKPWRASARSCLSMPIAIMPSFIDGRTIVGASRSSAALKQLCF